VNPFLGRPSIHFLPLCQSGHPFPFSAGASVGDKNAEEMCSGSKHKVQYSGGLQGRAGGSFARRVHTTCQPLIGRAGVPTWDACVAMPGPGRSYLGGVLVTGLKWNPVR
jgi:hypothetical protein